MDRDDHTFAAMGGTLRVLAEHAAPAPAAAPAARALLRAADARLSRFDPRSELSRLNADPRPCVPASPLLRAAVRAALWAAEASGGLVDPTLLGDLERAGYAASRAPALPAPPPPGRPAARPAAARPGRAWAAVRVDDAAGTIARPPGLRLDTAGTTKGLAADLAARPLAGARRAVVDCAGDLRVLLAPGEPPVDVLVEHPLGGGVAASLQIAGGGVATSGITRRAWPAAGGGGVAHHLLDPATGVSAWTGLLAATALAPTALAAEVLAKVALLGGPAGARRALARHGGVIVHDDGAVEHVAPRRVVLPRMAVAA